MAAIMTKRGNQDNVITYEFVCDSTDDLQAIEPQYITMGSVATILQGSGGLEVYMANSNKEWISLMEAGTSGGGSEGSNNESSNFTIDDMPKEKNINFVDYDGTLLYSYTNQEFLALDALPENPTHEGLIAQGWNWNLADAKAYARKNPKMWIGQHYITDDNTTRFFIDVPYNLEFGIEIYTADENDFDNLTYTIDWGDNSEPYVKNAGSGGDMYEGIYHTYEQGGKYVISISSNLIVEIYPTTTAYDFVTDIQFNSNTIIGIYYYHNLRTVTICNNAVGYTQDNKMSMYIKEIPLLKCIVIPNTINTIEYESFYYCHIITVCLPNSIIEIQQWAFYSVCILNMHIPSNITAINYRSFNYVSGLPIILPAGVETLDSYSFTLEDASVIYISNTEPCTIHNDTFNYYNPIICVPYSPDHSVLNAYKSATNWSNYADYIYEWEVPSYD